MAINVTTLSYSVSTTVTSQRLRFITVLITGLDDVMHLLVK